jgi:hypothetical protein
VWPGGGHFPHLAEPDRLARRLLESVEHCPEQHALREAMYQV